MANKDWDELLMLYLAGRLSAQERADFERYLAENAEYQQELVEWQQIADAVRAEAEARVDHLPPLRLPKLMGQSPNGSHSRRRMETETMLKSISIAEQRSSRMPPLTMVAAILTVLLFGALLVVVNRGGDQNPLLSGLEQGASATPSWTVTASSTPTYTPTVAPSSTPFPTRTPTPVPSSTLAQEMGAPIVTTMPTVPPPGYSVDTEPLSLTATPVPFGGGQRVDPLMSVTPSQLEPIISSPARLMQQIHLATGDGARAIDWANENVLVAGYRGAWLYNAAQLNGAARLLPDDTSAGLVSAAFNADGSLAATLNWDRTLRVWDVEQGTQVTVVQGAPLWGTLLFTPDGTGIYSTLDAGLVIVDVDAGTAEIGSLPAGGNAYFLYSPDEQTAAVIRSEGTVEIVDAASGQSLRSFGEPGEVFVRQFAYSPDGQLLVLGTTAGTVTLWDVERGEQQAVIDGDGLVMGLVFSADGSKLAIVRNARQLNSLWLYDVAGDAQTPLVVYDIPLVGPAFGPDAQELVVGSDDGRVLLLTLED
ncbi:MAG: hypothetical protein K8L99_36380 [Anaerolineae bacterium]|nr:hypothetical protein [Anaerolineae bacterium]